jgi:uncharacterized protein YprB with RNaseH-like and TPR domain
VIGLEKDLKMDILEEIKGFIQEAAKKFNVEPFNVTPAQFWLVSENITEWQLRKRGGFTAVRDALFPKKDSIDPNKKAKVLIFDIETAPILAHVWQLWDQTVGLNQIENDWHVLSWSAKWLDDPEDKIMYMDQRNAKNIEDDKEILEGIWKLLDEADVVITQNGKAFDQKKLNARFVMNGMQPPSTFKHIDTKVIAKKHFAFTSNSLEYMTSHLCTKYKKLKHAKFSGFSLWKACLEGNLEAWEEMRIYNNHDVLSLEELYKKLAPWDNSVDFNIYHNGLENTCSCGSSDFIKYGLHHTKTGVFQRYRCKKCGSETRDSSNLLSKEKRASLKKPTNR